MREVIEILNGYLGVIDGQIKELGEYIVLNRERLDYSKVKMMCENVLRELNKYESTKNRAFSLLRELSEVKDGKNEQ